MSVATYTSTVYAAQPKSLPTGLQAVSGKAQWTAAGTVGDIVFLCKIPHGATIIDAGEYHTSGQTAAALSLGFDRGIAAGGAGNASCLIASGAIATHNKMSLAASPTGAPVTISLSDLDPVRYAVLQAKGESGTLTITVSFGWYVIYHQSGPETV